MILYFQSINIYVGLDLTQSSKFPTYIITEHGDTKKFLKKFLVPSVVTFLCLVQ